MKALITGHAQFANGMKSALELIAGPQEELQVLPFDESTILDEFQNLLVNFFDGEDDKVVFTDLFGGTLFNQAMLAKGNCSSNHVYSGTNLAMLLEFVTNQMVNPDNPELLQKVEHSAKEGITFDPHFAHEESDESDGI